MSEEQSIVAGILPIACGLAGHIYLARLNSCGQVVAELNGLATGIHGEAKPIGYLPSDRLKVHETSKNLYYQPSHKQMTLYSGSAEKVEKIWQKAQHAAEKLNGLNLPYPFLGWGPNSNSVALTLVEQMGLEKPNLTYRLTPYRNVDLLANLKNDAKNT